MRKKVTRYQAHFRKFKARRDSHIRRVSRHPFAVPVATLLGLMLITGGLVLFFRRQPDTINPNVVVISHDDKVQIVSSKEPNVGSLLSKLQIALNEGDVVEPSPETPIKQDDFRINIY